MGKMKELSILIDEIADCGERLKEAAEAIRGMFTSDEEPEQEAPKAKKAKPKEEPAAPAADPEPEPEKTYDKTEVRKILAKLSQDGHKDDVIALLGKYGAGNISGLKESDYAAVVAEAEVIANG